MAKTMPAWKQNDGEAPAMDLAEFRRLGYLQEVNRRMLHPLGLALYLVAAATLDGPPIALSVEDYRDDLEGVAYEDEAITTPEAVERRDHVRDEWDRRVGARLADQGWAVQPLPDEGSIENDLVMIGGRRWRGLELLRYAAAEVKEWSDREYDDDIRMVADMGRVVDALTAALGTLNGTVDLKRCRLCGCTEDSACRTPAGPCGWVTDEVCTAHGLVLERSVGP